MPVLELLPLGRGVAQWTAWTTTARLVTTDPDVVGPARRLAERELDLVDLAASRFRADSEVRRLADARGGAMPASPLLLELVRVALDAAAATDGDVDPTLGASLSALGYDMDIDRVAARPVSHVPQRSSSLRVMRRVDWHDVVLGDDWIQVPAGMILDLGATAKAWAADRVAAMVVQEYGGGALMSLGGDLSVAGTDPDGGWTILVQDGPAEPASLIGLERVRAVATSSILGRTWRLGDQRMHHILDPMTRRPAAAIWRTVSVAAECCVSANVLATAALVRGIRAPDMLGQSGAPARLVALDGAVTTLNGWPTT